MKKCYFVVISIFIQFCISARPFCVSHRALGFGELENSIAAFRTAMRNDVDAIEFDLLHTKDGKTIVYHDKKLKRLVSGVNCPIGEKVKDLSLSQIQSHCRLINGELIPTLNDALQVLSHGESKLFIEFKDKPLFSDFELIEEYFKNYPEKVFIISFDGETLRQVNMLRMKSPFYQNVATVKLQKFGYFSKFEDFDMVSAKYIHKKKVKCLQDKGKLVGVYTKDKDSKIRKYLKKGVDFITTNRPRRCLELIFSNKLF